MIVSEFEEYAYSIGVDDIGYTTIPEEYTTSQMYPNTIVTIKKFEDDLLYVTPKRSLKVEYKRLYFKLTSIMEHMCEFIESKGYHTHMIDQFDKNVNFTLIAKRANMGEIGNSRLLITDKAGPGHKIMLITTDMPVPETPKEKEDNLSLVKDTCNTCLRCVANCPEGALSFENSKIKFDKEKCIGYTHGCTKCIINCPYQKK